MHDAKSRVNPPNDEFIKRQSMDTQPIAGMLIRANDCFDSMFADHVIISIQLKYL